MLHLHYMLAILKSTPAYRRSFRIIVKHTLRLDRLRLYSTLPRPTGRRPHCEDGSSRRTADVIGKYQTTKNTSTVTTILTGCSTSAPFLNRMLQKCNDKMRYYRLSDESLRLSLTFPTHPSSAQLDYTSFPRRQPCSPNLASCITNPIALPPTPPSGPPQSQLSFKTL